MVRRLASAEMNPTRAKVCSSQDSSGNSGLTELCEDATCHVISVSHPSVWSFETESVVIAARTAPDFAPAGMFSSQPLVGDQEGAQGPFQHNCMLGGAEGCCGGDIADFSRPRRLYQPADPPDLSACTQITAPPPANDGRSAAAGAVTVRFAWNPELAPAKA